MNAHVLQCRYSDDVGLDGEVSKSTNHFPRGKCKAMDRKAPKEDQEEEEHEIEPLHVDSCLHGVTLPAVATGDPILREMKLRSRLRQSRCNFPDGLQPSVVYL